MTPFSEDDGLTRRRFFLHGDELENDIFRDDAGEFPSIVKLE